MCTEKVSTYLDLQSYVPHHVDLKRRMGHPGLMALGQRDLSNELKPQLLDLTSAWMRSQEISELGIGRVQRDPKGSKGSQVHSKEREVMFLDIYIYIFISDPEGNHP